MHFQPHIVPKKYQKCRAKVAHMKPAKQMNTLLYVQIKSRNNIVPNI